ncbi:hypothetical protein ACFV3R_24815 [Streptomyces sp. NPDC059740]|uniref:CTP synthase C-terminal region-related (seleno)protein n=1 Tax=Streptomyces sp. NPDC059740 TaxID=3346926 RepID=UPI0036629E11
MTSAPPVLAPARLALVADRSPAVRAHTRVPRLLDSLARRDHLVLDAYWVPTPDAAQPEALAGFDAVWLLPGSPYRSESGALAAVRYARTAGVPFLGTCAGFQYALLEFARDVCGLPEAAHAETRPGAAAPLIAELACSLKGHEGTVHVAADSLAQRVLGAGRRVERYSCAYGPHRAAAAALTAHGLRFSGVDEDGEARIAELAGHPFFLATLFQPELAEDEAGAHPAVRALAAAAVAHAARRTGEGREAGGAAARQE